MPTRIVFEDRENNEMNCYLNAEGYVFLGISRTGEPAGYGGSIVLDKSDVGELIRLLSSLEAQMSGGEVFEDE